MLRILDLPNRGAYREKTRLHIEVDGMNKIHSHRFSFNSALFIYRLGSINGITKMKQIFLLNMDDHPQNTKKIPVLQQGFFNIVIKCLQYRRFSVLSIYKPTEDYKKEILEVYAMTYNEVMQ